MVGCCATEAERKDYEAELSRLHGELVARRWVSPPADLPASVALPGSLTERERSQMYVQRHMAYFPAAREVVIFDRSWYPGPGWSP